MPVFQDDFANHMGLFSECANEKIEKCFFSNKANAVQLSSIAISSVEKFIFLGYVSFMTV